MSACEYSTWNDLESGKNFQTNFIALKYKIILGTSIRDNPCFSLKRIKKRKVKERMLVE